MDQPTRHLVNLWAHQPTKQVQKIIEGDINCSIAHMIPLKLSLPVRAMSLIRVFKHTRVWPQLSLLIKSFFKSVKGTFGLMIVLVIVLSIYALLGHQLFAKNDASLDIRSNFNTFGSSFLMTFVLLTGDGWKGEMMIADIMFDYELVIIGSSYDC